MRMQFALWAIVMAFAAPAQANRFIRAPAKAPSSFQFVPAFLGSMSLSLDQQPFYASQWLKSFNHQVSAIETLPDPQTVAATLQAGIEDGTPMVTRAAELGKGAVPAQRAAAIPAAKMPAPVPLKTPTRPLVSVYASDAPRAAAPAVIAHTRRHLKRNDWGGLFENGRSAPAAVNAAEGFSTRTPNPLKGAWPLLRLKEAHRPSVAGAALALVPLAAVPSVGSYAMHEFFHFMALKLFRVPVGSMRYFYTESHSWDSWTSGGYVNHAAIQDPRQEFWVAIAGPIGSAVHFALMSALLAVTGGALTSLMSSLPIPPGPDLLAGMGLGIAFFTLIFSWFLSGIKAVTAFAPRKSDIREARSAWRRMR